MVLLSDEEFDGFCVTARMRRIPFNESYFSQDTEGSFYWAGFLAADGSVRHTNMKVGKCKDGTPSYSDSYLIEASQNDRQHLELFNSHLDSEPRKLTERKYLNRKENVVKTHYKLHLRSEQMYKDLSRFGIVEHKSHYLDMPDWLSHHYLVRHYIRGYFDGDGAIFWTTNKSKKKIQKNPVIDIVGTFDFLTKVREVLAREIKFRANVRRIKGKEYTARIVWSGPKITAQIASWMYQDCTIFLPRKHEIAMPIIYAEQLAEPFRPAA